MHDEYTLRLLNIEKNGLPYELLDIKPMKGGDAD